MSTVATKAKGIIFSAPMVRAILSGRKSQTRRRLDLQPQFEVESARVYDSGYCELVSEGRHDEDDEENNIKAGDPTQVAGQPCWYGCVGSILWVRESFEVTHDGMYYLADGEEIKQVAGAKWEGKLGRKSSLHMPRWASRITIEITDVRVQRVQEITEADAQAEGCVRPVIGCALDEFFKLWEQIHGKGAWSRNEWVWAISFRRIEHGNG